MSYDFLNIIFAPLLKLPVFWAVVALAFTVSLLVIFITKFSTDQVLMKKLKEDLKDYQKRIKELRNEPAKAMEVQKRAMELNMKYMTHSLRPTLITFLPIILIFGWMSSNFAYEGIKSGQDFSVSAVFQKNTNGEVELIAPEGVTILDKSNKKIQNDIATWNLRGIEGEYSIEFDYNGEKNQKSVLISNAGRYVEPTKKIKDSNIKLIQINYKKLVVLPVGYKDWFGWLGTYIIFSIIFTMTMRKLMKVY